MIRAVPFLVFLSSSLSLLTRTDAAMACQAEFLHFKTCMGTAFNQVVQKADVDSNLAKVRECFQRANCKVSNQFSSGAPSVGARCNKGVFTQLGRSVEACMKKKAPQFSYKQLMKKETGTTSYRFDEAKKKIGKMVLMRQDVKVCPAQTRQQVDNCRKPILHQSNEDLKRYIDELCSAKHSCAAKLSGTCKKELEERKQDFINCACDIIEGDADKYAHEFLACVGRTDSPIVEGTVKRRLPKLCKKLRRKEDICRTIKSLLSSPVASFLQG